MESSSEATREFLIRLTGRIVSFGTRLVLPQCRSDVPFAPVDITHSGVGVRTVGIVIAPEVAVVVVVTVVAMNKRCLKARKS